MEKAGIPDTENRAMIREGAADSAVAILAIAQEGQGTSPRKYFAMESKPNVRGQFVTQMQENMQSMLGQIPDAINHAPTGQVISRSEEQVRAPFVEPLAANLRDGTGPQYAPTLPTLQSNRDPSERRGGLAQPMGCSDRLHRKCKRSLR
jgi:hypothetical protein